MVKLQVNHKLIKQALLIRNVEEKFLDLFSQGKLNGTVHTCVGQEFSAVAFAGQLKSKDFVFSNHRCHGHYIAFTGDYQELIAELMGKASGTSGGIGSSQHLCKNNFFSNGIQGGIVPVAAGYALANKLKENGAIGVVYIGDGTLGEGALYETMNIISKWEIPLLIVCENNFYAQSTPQDVNLAGDIQSRAEAFGIKTAKSNTSDVEEIMSSAKESIEYVRETGKPFFHLVETYRLNAHSKGDDDRDKNEVEEYRAKDFLVRFEQEMPSYFSQYNEPIREKIDTYVEEVLKEEELPLSKYYTPDSQEKGIKWEKAEPFKKRQVELINEFFKEKMSPKGEIVFIGEDILSPYGGAFKVARDLSHLFPNRVFSTPISEAAIMGISNGLALNGFKPFAEIMFGDFILLAMDQIVNHASKFFHMFNFQANCPVVVRTPMGGRRGYGPTHSQTLDKFLIGIDNVKTLALSTYLNPKDIFNSILDESHPVILLENKKDYGKRINLKVPKNYKVEKTIDKYPWVRITPMASKPMITIFAYGGMVEIAIDCIEKFFYEHDLIVEILIPSKISPMDHQPIIESIQKTHHLFVIEEGSVIGGIGSEVVSIAVESKNPVIAKRIGAFPVPIPSVRSLEDLVLPDSTRIISEIIKMMEI